MGCKKSKKGTLLSLIKEHVVEGAIIKSDEWSSYKCLDKEEFNHLKVNHSISFTISDGIDTNLIEGMWSHVKKLFKNGSSTRKNLTQQYLDFFSFFSYAKSKNLSAFDLFLNVLSINYDIK